MLEPREALARQGLCPVCEKRLTGGVLARVEALADRPSGFRPPGARTFTNLIPLGEVLGEVIGVGAASERVERAWTRLVGKVGSELDVLMQAPLEDIRKEAPPLLDEALRRMRAGEVKTQPGYDGEYGIIRVFDEAERRALLAQRSFAFGVERIDRSPTAEAEARTSGASAGEPERGPDEIDRPLSSAGEGRGEVRAPDPHPSRRRADLSRRRER